MAATDSIDLDKIVNYKTEYCAVIQQFKITGDNLTGLCPFHADNNNSFSVNLRTGQWKCFAEDRGGNFVSFWAELNNVSTKDAYKAILDKYGVSREEQPKKKKSERKPPGAYSLEQYAFEKRLPEDFLIGTCRASTDRERDGTTYLRLPYIDHEGTEKTVRKRFASKEFRWKQGAGKNICLYGEWRIGAIRDKGYAVLVEGESDTQSLWYMGIPALGVPGASMFKPAMADTLQDLRVYLHKEPDNGGETFVRKVAEGLKAGSFIGEVYLWRCSDYGVKDPSELYLKYGKEDAASKIRAALEKAEPLDLDRAVVPATLTGAPINLRTPEGWTCADDGIRKAGSSAVVCRTPVILTRRLQNIDTGEEKMDVAFRRDGTWTTVRLSRSTLFTNRGIINLADYGCTVTSENAKHVVKFLAALEAENIDIIPRVRSTSAFGWKADGSFVPSDNTDIVLDVSGGQNSIASGYCKKGTLENWIAHMQPHRERDRFRFILAASFAAPLLKIVNQRIFFVYNWGESRGGKTAGLKAALSAWGNPERLMITFNATQAGLERTAALFSDLPLGIDERQAAGGKQGALESLVYMLASGTSKVRANKDGSTQPSQQWRTIALATGEEPLTKSSTKTGVSTRIIDLYGGPFDDEKSAGLMHQQSGEDYGWAGPEYIKRIQSLDETYIAAAFAEMRKYVESLPGEPNGSIVSGISVVALADALVDSWFFGVADGEPRSVGTEFLEPIGVSKASWVRAKAMAARILREEADEDTRSVNEQALQVIVDWISRNENAFGDDITGDRCGWFSADKSEVYIIPAELSNALEQKGFSSSKTMRYLEEKDLIEVSGTGTNKKRSIVKKLGGQSRRVVAFHIGKYVSQIEAQAKAQKDADGHKELSTTSTWAQTSFSEVNEDDEELPF